MEIRKVTLNLLEEDCKFLEQVYGEKWTERMEAHIHNEVRLRSHDKESLLKMRKEWNY